MGMIATALILGLRTNAAPMSDAEIMEKARQLGMVESSSLMLSDLQNQEPDSVQREETEPQSTESEDENVTETDEPDTTSLAESDTTNPAESDGANDENTANSDASDITSPVEPDEENAANSDETDMTDSTETKKDIIYSDDPVLFTIEEGSNSYTVSKSLAAVGLVKDVVSFDNFLIDNGYSKSIRSGTYEILPGTSEKDIARIITGK